MRLVPVDAIEFVGGRLCLDFANTANWSGDEILDEKLIDLNAVRTWVDRKKLAMNPRLDGKLDDLLALRGAMRRIIKSPDTIDEGDLAILNTARRLPADPLGRDGHRLGIDAGGSMDWLMRTLADSAAELMLTVERRRIKTCHGECCGWLFVDESPNNRRRWCSMADCGNRAKAKRHYQRSLV